MVSISGQNSERSQVWWWTVVVVAAILASVGPARLYEAAAASEETVYLRGFVSQGYLNTSSNNYLVPRSVNGTAEFTEAAVIVSAQPWERVRVGVQLLARNFGNQGNGEVVVDWAYGDYRWRDELGLRAGKVKMPFGLYNEGRDIDLLRTSVFLPQSVYPVAIRDLVLAYDGAGAYGSLTLGDLGDLDYHVYGGTLNVNDATTGYWRENYEAVGQFLEAEVGQTVDEQEGLPAGTAEAFFNDLGDPQVTFPWIWGAAVQWSSPLDDLRLGLSFVNGRYNYQGAYRYEVRIPSATGPDNWQPVRVDVDETTAIDHLFVLSAEYVHDDLTLASELYLAKMGPAKEQGWYGLASYRLGDVVSAGAYYAAAWPDYTDKGGERYVRQGLPDYYAWQKDLTTSLRFDLTDFWLFKLEYHFIDGVGQVDVRSLLVDSEERPVRRWGMLAAKTTFVF